MRSKRTRIRHLKIFFDRLEKFRRRNLWKRRSIGKRRKKARMALPPGVLDAIARQLPSVIRVTKSAWVYDASGELINEFVPLAATVGRSLQSEEHNDSQYLFLLLCRSANRVTKSYRILRQSYIDHNELRNLAQALPAVEMDEKDVTQAPMDPLQTVEQVRAVLGEMSSKVCRTATWVWFDRVGIEEAAKRDKVTINAVNLRLHQARMRLSRRLKIPLHLRHHADGKEPSKGRPRRSIPSRPRGSGPVRCQRKRLR